MKRAFILEIGLALIIYLFFWESIWFSPIRVFFVSIHESMHALVTILTGGAVASISLDGYEGLMTPSRNGFVPLVAIAGYVGSAIVGAILIATKHKTMALIILDLFVLGFILIFSKTYFSLEFFSVIVVSIGVLFMALRDIKLEYVSGVIGSLLAFGSVQDVKMYLLRIPGKTDSGILADYLGFHSLTILISLFMLSLTVFIYYLGIKTRLKQQNKYEGYFQ